MRFKLLAFIPLFFRGFAEFRNVHMLSHIFEALRFTSTSSPSGNPSIGFLLAHPDDESMFFLPTLGALKSIPKPGEESTFSLYFLYLSNGNAEGKGEARELELANLCEHYGYTCKVVNDPLLQDGDSKWDPEHALPHLKKFVNDHSLRVLFTFDGRGVSGHPNHISAYETAKLASKEMDFLKVFYLQSINMVTKYLSFFSLYMMFYKA
ncbi:N-acetylglucosaminyl-phosphatidylinositolde-N-ace tylase [Theileria annulata]|uniref:N-acetylglucosaminylphosphatidylinositol deacetylase n=1 Tax=Theileria annulata TaxID=5874 RepID=Q4U970_THEAN|nr:N-acetylglucosaminyl-phosphatidylinositolde-N-ace tylase [Theileria annulata]CAI76633.1 N-acetylglucosaminyl-phosphatidylinositolde-N-acetylase [Theileria annulata]|eukprot:XP_953258.1 N-acetylglucosaminyl-phosphatidylinositolde-N-acetylase [Theileria annulata]